MTHWWRSRSKQAVRKASRIAFFSCLLMVLLLRCPFHCRPAGKVAWLDVVTTLRGRVCRRQAATWHVLDLATAEPDAIPTGPVTLANNHAEGVPIPHPLKDFKIRVLRLLEDDLAPLSLFIIHARPGVAGEVQVGKIRTDFLLRADLKETPQGRFQVGGAVHDLAVINDLPPLLAASRTISDFPEFQAGVVVEATLLGEGWTDDTDDKIALAGQEGEDGYLQLLLVAGGPVIAADFLVPLFVDHQFSGTPRVAYRFMGRAQRLSLWFHVDSSGHSIRSLVFSFRVS